MFQIDHKLKQNTLFTQAAKYKFKLNIFMIIIIYFTLWLAGLSIGRLTANVIVTALTSAFTINSSLIFALRKFIICGMQISVFLIWVRYIEKRPVKTMGIWGANPIRSYFKGFFIGFAAISLITVILILLGMVEIKGYNADFAPLLLLTIALGWVVQSASEEIAVRGWLIPVLGSGSTPITAIILTSIIFGILHLFSSGVTILSFANLFFSGIFFALYAIYSNNIMGVCGLHFAWNFSLGNFYGFPVSGFPPAPETVLMIKQTGSIFFTGGAFGPEGGFITTIVLLTGICILVILMMKRYVTK